MTRLFSSFHNMGQALAVVVFIASASACATPSKLYPSASISATLRPASDARLAHLRGQIMTLAFASPALSRNLLGDSPQVRAIVYLPPAYAVVPTQRFPVIYSLAGFPPPSAFAQAATISPHESMFVAVDTAIAQHRLNDVIVVHIDGRTRLGGSFWTNSDVAGDWEDVVADELVAAVDGRLRSIADSNHRALYGVSMGGFGALSIAMDRPGIFSSVFAQSPCCLAMLGELAAGPAWRGLLGLASIEQARSLFEAGHPEALQALALAVAFAPDRARAPLYSAWPYRAQGKQIVAAEPARSRWLAHLPMQRLDAQAVALKGLRGLRIQYGRRDELKHIVLSLPEFDRALTAHGVLHEFQADDGGHMDLSRFARDAVPFFARTLGSAAP